MFAPVGAVAATYHAPRARRGDMLPAEGIGVRSEISRSEQLRVAQIALAVLAAVSAWMATGIVARPAAAKTHARSSTSAYRQSLRFSSRLLLGNLSEDPIAVDRHGTIYVFKATRTQQGSIPSGDAADVEELSPGGKQIRSFSTTSG